MAKYEVVVGNIGTIHRGANKTEAAKVYADAVIRSISGRGRGGNEEVTLFEDGEIIAECASTLED